MAVTTKNFDTLVKEQATAIQGKSSSLTDLTIGSIMRAFIEANAGMALWLQGLILQAIKLSRASTSTGSDLDSWVTDFGLTRLTATKAGGDVTFARASTTAASPAVTIPAGTVVKTSTGVEFAVGTTGTGYDSTLAGYVLAQGASSITLPVTAVVAGAAGNVVAGAINTYVGTLAGIATVTNAAGFTSAIDVETDAALRTRFLSFIAGLSRATKTAIGSALSGVQANLDYQIVENLTTDGVASPGYFYAVIDDGTGAVPAATITLAQKAIETYRPLGTTFGVIAATPQTINVSMTVKSSAGASTALQATVQTEVTKYLNGLKIGEDVSFTKVADTAYNSSTLVTNVSGITLSGSTSASDVVISNQQKAKAGTVAITVV